MLIEADKSFDGLERFLDTPALPGCCDQGSAGPPAVVRSSVGVLTGRVVAADEQMVESGVGGVLG